MEFAAQESYVIPSNPVALLAFFWLLLFPHQEFGLYMVLAFYITFFLGSFVFCDNLVILLDFSQIFLGLAFSWSERWGIISKQIYLVYASCLFSLGCSTELALLKVSISIIFPAFKAIGSSAAELFLIIPAADAKIC